MSGWMSPLDPNAFLENHLDNFKQPQNSSQPKIQIHFFFFLKLIAKPSGIRCHNKLKKNEKSDKFVPGLFELSLLNCIRLLHENS